MSSFANGEDQDEVQHYALHLFEYKHKIVNLYNVMIVHMSF